MVVEPSIECYNRHVYNAYTKLYPFCCLALAIYALGIPMLFGVLLAKNRKVRVGVDLV
jgi:hypothetical protein